VVIKRMHLRRAVLAAICCWLSHGKLLAATVQCGDTIDISAPVLSDGFAFNTSNTRNNTSGINSSNVASLQLAYAHIAAGATEKRGAPAATAQALFFSAGLNIVAVNRSSGCQYWSYGIPDMGHNALRSSSVYYLNEGASKPALVLAGDTHGNYYAVDAKTGKLLWQKFLGTDPAHHMITGGAQFYAGRMFVPISSNEVVTSILEPEGTCCKTHGMLQAIDPYTGAIVWTYNTAPEAAWNRDKQLFAPNGMSIWGTPAIDPVRGSVYIGTGQNLTPPTTNNEDAIVTLDIQTGTPKWVFQGTSGDAWNAACLARDKLLSKNCLPAPPGGGDFDFGAPPVLVHLANGHDAIIAGEKSGMVFSLDPDSGRPNWSRRVGAGGNLGGIHWGMAADSARVYIGVSDITVNKVPELTPSNVSNIRSLVPNKIEQSINAAPGIYALDLMTGEIVWQRHPRHNYSDPERGVQTVDSIYSAALSVTNDVVFAGSLDGILKAFRASDGTEVWSYDTARSFTDLNGYTGRGGSIDSVGAVPLAGDLLINSGYSTFSAVNRFQAGPGNALLVFRLPAKHTPREGDGE
jgi:polyvinyl alcohol dehydrogenase (cytochrome)